MNNVYIKTYNELTPDEIQTFRNSRIYRNLQDHYIFNELSELYYRQYFENKKTNNSQILFSNRNIIALLPSLAEPHFLEFAGMPTEFFFSDDGFTKRNILSIFIKHIKKRFSEANLSAKFKYEPSVFREFYTEHPCLKEHHVGIVNLKYSNEAINKLIRNSFKQLIKWGNTHLKINIIDCNNPVKLEFMRFKKLHEEASGRQTRPNKTWETQFLMIQNKGAFLVNAYLDDELVSGCFITHDTTNALYAVAATNRTLMEQGMPLNHATLYQAILRAKEIGCARFMLGDVTDGYVNESADDKYLSIAAFKRGFATEIEIEKNLQVVFSSLTKT